MCQILTNLSLDKCVICWCPCKPLLTNLSSMLCMQLCNVLFAPNETHGDSCMCITSECLTGQKIMTLAGAAAISMATNTQVVPVAGPAAILRVVIFFCFKISQVNANVSVWLSTFDACSKISLPFLELTDFIFSVYGPDKQGGRIPSLQHCHFSLSDFLKLTWRSVSCTNMPEKLAVTWIELSGTKAIAL